MEEVWSRAPESGVRSVCESGSRANATDRSDRSSCADKIRETGYKQAIVQQMDGWMDGVGYEAESERRSADPESGGVRR